MNLTNSFVPLGYAQLTSLGAATPLTIPANANRALLIAETQNVRFRDDGVAPTASIGFLLVAGVTFEYSGTLSRLLFIQTAASAVLNVLFYRQSG